MPKTVRNLHVQAIAKLHHGPVRILTHTFVFVHGDDFF